MKCMNFNLVSGWFCLDASPEMPVWLIRVVLIEHRQLLRSETDDRQHGQTKNLVVLAMSQRFLGIFSGTASMQHESFLNCSYRLLLILSVPQSLSTLHGLLNVDWDDCDFYSDHILVSVTVKHQVNVLSYSVYCLWMSGVAGFCDGITTAAAVDVILWCCQHCQSRSLW